MKQVTILQVGDLHYDLADTAPEVDQKDVNVSPNLVAAAAPGRFPAVMKALQRLCDREIPDGVAFCGDLTTRGCLKVYEECLDYLDLNLGLAEKRYWSDERIHSVPGNHDVNRDLVDPSGEDLYKKFVPLMEFWKERKTDVLACDQLRATSLGESGGEVRAFSLNSSIGCGELRARQGEFTEEFRKDLELRKTTGDAAAADALWEGIDTPLFQKEHLEELDSQIEDLDSAVLPVITAHHNLLPQATPRIAVYTELLNGGAARVRLASHNRWALYLHGHIHDDPIEIIEQRAPHSGQILSISAPEFRDGFNLVTIEFGELGMPMGAIVVHHRFERGGEVRARPAIRIGLASRSEVTDPLLGRVMKTIAPGETVRFRELVERLDGVIDEEKLAGALREAEWVGHLTLANRKEDPKHWTIGRDVL